MAQVEWWRDGKRRCGTCKGYLDPESFHKNATGKPHDGLHFRCKRCEWSNQTFRRYGITGDQYDEILTAQGGGCAICTEKPDAKRFAVDHDHACCPGSKHGRTCGKCVRSILCENCNHMLGKAQDDAARLRAAADYLDKWSNDGRVR